jgi:ATP-dependent Lon protease
VRGSELRIDFAKYCLEPAKTMRGTVRKQMQIIDPDQFGGKNLATFYLKDKDE